MVLYTSGQEYYYRSFQNADGQVTKIITVPEHETSLYSIHFLLREGNMKGLSFSLMWNPRIFRRSNSDLYKDSSSPLLKEKIQPQQNIVFLPSKICLLLTHCDGMTLKYNPSITTAALVF